MSASHKPPRIIPVLDVMNGQVVRAVAGKRDKYRPIVSKLTTSTEPVEVAKALLTATGAGELYVADLDAITGADRASRAVAQLSEQCGCRLFADVGIRTEADFALLSDRPERSVATSFSIRLAFRAFCKQLGNLISGWPSPQLKNVVPVLGSETLVGNTAALSAGGYYLDEWAFSLDLYNGRLLGDWSAWVDFDVRSDEHVWEMAATAVWNCGAGTLILLDLANVGTGAGPGTEYWCRKIRATLPDVELIAGGGVRSWDDVERLGEAGADAVLVASALHDGTLGCGPVTP